MALYTAAQQKRIIKAIRDRMIAFLAEVYGPDKISEADANRLKQAGLLDESIDASLIDNSFVLGKLESYMTKAEFKNYTYTQLMDDINGVELTDVDHHVIDHLHTNSLQLITNMRRDVERGIFDKLIGLETGSIAEDIVRTALTGVLTEGYKDQLTQDEVASELARATGTWDRDWNMVARTEVWNSMLHGHALSMVNGEGGYVHADGINSKVAKVPDPNACSDCMRLYIDPKTGEPKIFELETLVNNGNNKGRGSHKNWRPVLGPMHPRCFCQLVYVPDGYEFKDSVLSRLKEDE